MRIRKPAGLAAIIVAIVACSACRVDRPQVDHATQQDLYTIFPNDPRTFNPVVVTDATSGRVVEDVFESFLGVDYHTLLPEPRIAQSWEVSKDEKTVTFHLRHDIKWFDGQPVTARDVLFTLKVIDDPKIPTSLRSTISVDGKPLVVTARTDGTSAGRCRLPTFRRPLDAGTGRQLETSHANAHGRRSAAGSLRACPARPRSRSSHARPGQATPEAAYPTIL